MSEKRVNDIIRSFMFKNSCCIQVEEKKETEKKGGGDSLPLLPFLGKPILSPFLRTVLVNFGGPVSTAASTLVSVGAVVLAAMMSSSEGSSAPRKALRVKSELYASDSESFLAIEFCVSINERVSKHLYEMQLVRLGGRILSCNERRYFSWRFL